MESYDLEIISPVTESSDKLTPLLVLSGTVSLVSDIFLKKKKTFFYFIMQFQRMDIFIPMSKLSIS